MPFGKTGVILNLLNNSSLFSYLEVIEDHFPELLHRCPSGGFIEHGGFSVWLWLFAELIVGHFSQLAADDAVVIPPASCVNLEAVNVKVTLRLRLHSVTAAKCHFNMRDFY